jgi:hypothetical protein
VSAPRREDYGLYHLIGICLYYLAFLSLALAGSAAIVFLVIGRFLWVLWTLLGGFLHFCCLYAMSRTIVILLEVRDLIAAQQGETNR